METKNFFFLPTKLFTNKICKKTKKLRYVFCPFHILTFDFQKNELL